MDQDTTGVQEKGENHHSIGKIIKILRHYVNLTEEEFANGAKLDSITLSLIENGTIEPDRETLEGIAEFLDLPIEILELQEDHPNQELITELRELILVFSKIKNKQ